MTPTRRCCEDGSGSCAFQQAQEQGWDVGADAQDHIDEALAFQTEEASLSADTFLAVKHQARHYGQGPLYQAWLIETWSAHACLASAQAYLSSDGAGNVTLLSEPRPQHVEVAAAVTSTLHTALTVYNRVLPGAPLSAMLGAVHAEFEALAASLARRPVRDSDKPPAQSP